MPVQAFALCQRYQLLEKVLGHDATCQVVINADDLGLSIGVNDAIFRLTELGAISSASLLPVGDDYERAAQWSRQQSSISIGIHLCLTDHLLPLTSAPGLVDKSRQFLPFQKVARRAYLHTLPLASVFTEWKAQIGRVRASGILPTHLDSHQHVHLLPGLQDIIVRLAQEEGLAVRHTAGPFGFSFAACWRCAIFWQTLWQPGIWKSALLRWQGTRLKQRLFDAGIPAITAYISPSSLCGRYRRVSGMDTAMMIAQMASSLEGLVEWVVHPSDTAEVEREPLWMSAVRSRETTLLSENVYKNLLGDKNISTVRYSL